MTIHKTDRFDDLGSKRFDLFESPSRTDPPVVITSSSMTTLSPGFKAGPSIIFCIPWSFASLRTMNALSGFAALGTQDRDRGRKRVRSKRWTADRVRSHRLGHMKDHFGRVRKRPSGIQGHLFAVNVILRDLFPKPACAHRMHHGFLLDQFQ